MSTSWANVARKTCGEKLVLYRGEYLTAKEYDRVKKLFPFKFLPLELREKILDMVVDEKVISFFLPGRYGEKPIPIPLPPVTKAGSVALRLEAIRITIMKTELSIHSGPANTKLQAWLGSIDLSKLEGHFKNGFDAVKRLQFPYFSRFPHRHLPADAPNNDIELMRKCKNLVSINLNFHPSEMFIDPYHDIEKTSDRLRKDYRLDGLLDLMNLEAITFTGYIGGDPNRGLHAVKAWLDEEFETQKENGLRKKGPNVVVP